MNTKRERVGEIEEKDKGCTSSFNNLVSVANMGDRMNTKRQRVGEEEGKDKKGTRSLLLDILPILPIKAVIKTCLLARRFQDLWTYLPVLRFDHRHFDNLSDFFLFVGHVTLLHNNDTLHKFVVNLPAANADIARKYEIEVDSWVHFALKKKVKVVDLDFVEPLEGDVRYRLPAQVFRANGLTELKLVGCEVKPIYRVQLNCLKTLFLKRIVLNDEIIHQILSGCPVLQELSLIHCYQICKLDFRNPSIESLVLDHNIPDRVKIFCPNVKKLDIAGSIDYVDLFDTSSVVDSSISFVHGFECVSEAYPTLKRLFKRLGLCKIFRPCDSCILV